MNKDIIVEAQYTDGLEIERFITNNTDAIDEFICPICHKVFYSPISCLSCENHFCKFCINKWVEKNINKCPYSCNFKERPSSKLMNTLLSKLKVRCKNEENGCNFQSNYESIFNHEKSCQFNNLACKYCKKPLSSEEKTNHLDNECIPGFKFIISELKDELNKCKIELEKEKHLRKEMEKFGKRDSIKLNKSESDSSNNNNNNNSILEISPEAKINKFYTWMNLNGIKFNNIEILFQDNEFMIFAKDNLSKGDEILFLPRKLLISYSMIENTDLIKSFDRQTKFNSINIQNPQKLSLIIYSLNEKQNKTDLSDYLDMHPHFNKQSSLLFDEQELHYLKGSALYEEIRVAKQEMKKDWNIIKDYLKGISYSDFCWAYLTVTNKNFNQADLNDTHLLPVLDFFLPDVPDNNQTSFEYIKNLDGYRLLANKNILKNRRIFNSSLKFSNQELIKKFGITFESNPLDYFEVYLFFNDFDPLINYKIEVFENKDEPFIFKIKNNLRLDNLGLFLSYLRIIECSDKNELKKSSSFYAKHAISLENEKKIFKKFELILRSKLKNYETDIKEDENLLRNNKLTLNQKHCIFVRYNEKRIIFNLIEFVELVQAILNKTISRKKVNNIDLGEYLKTVEHLL